MVTFWLIEAMSRVSRSDLFTRSLQLMGLHIQASNTKAHVKDYPELLEFRKYAFTHFDNVLSFSNHIGLFSEEVGMDGEQIGNIPQAFSHLACVSAAMNFVI